MSEDIAVGDAMYVSSKRASDISGYAQDYIGQLARKGLIDAKRIGGLWYVDMESLESHKDQPENASIQVNKESAALESQESPELTFDGKKYISANRASKITGYNQDYVGQLARSGKIISHQVGNRWFVDHEGILAHKNEKDSLLASVQAKAVGIYHDTSGNTPLEEQPSNEMNPEPSLLNYISDHGDLTPQIRARSESQIEPIRNAMHEDQDNHHYQVPIRKPKDMPALRSIPKPQRMSLRKNIHTQRPKVPLAVGVLILTVLITGSFGAALYASGSMSKNGFQGALSMTANAISSSSGNALKKISDLFEGIVDPELIYNRTN